MSGRHQPANGADSVCLTCNGAGVMMGGDEYQPCPACRGMVNPTIRAMPLLDFLDLLRALGAGIDTPQFHAGRRQALNEVRLYVEAILEPTVLS